VSTYLEPGWIEKFAELWEKLGPETRTALLDLLPQDWTFTDKRVLDFGCGAGRTLRHFLAEAEQAEIWGVDIDATSVELLRDTVCPPLHVMRSGYWPPLALESGYFDLIWSISVFTHMTDSSVPWLLELHRLLRPGGLLIATFMGRWTSELLAGEPWDEDRVGMNVLRHSHPASDGGPLVMMSEWWVREHWGRPFEVLEIVPQIHNQSWALLRRREVELTVQDVERPGNDPREAVALRHNLQQAQREIEALRRDEDAREDRHRREIRERELALERLRTYYERSRSWRLTRPLRAIGARARAHRARAQR
jgi:SAM-dependent methyltransferase